MSGAPDRKPFLPSIQRIDRDYRPWKYAALAAAALALFWINEGRALYRKRVVGLDGVAERARTADGFLAVSFPLITAKSERFTLSRADLEELLSSLRRRGFHSIGVDDVEDFYLRERLLPPKSVLLAFERDKPTSVVMSDEALEKERMRALLFINRTKPDMSVNGRFRFSLSRHALAQMRKGGAWDFGWYADDGPERQPGDPPRPPVLDLGEAKNAWTRNPFMYPLRFSLSRDGYNDSARLMAGLQLQRVRTDKTVDENLELLLASWPRRESFSDDFKKDGLGYDWVSERGVTVAIGGRLVLVPTPRQKSASVYLSGTDGWRDCVAEYTLGKYRKVAWLYARNSGERWLRVGVRNGYWLVQEKTGASHKPVTLARAPMSIVTTLPARVRVVLKGPWAIVHVNGRMQFGKAVRVHSGVDGGRVSLDVYDEKPAAALGVFTSFSAAPLRSRWLAVDGESVAGGPAGFQRLLEEARERAVFATALSPRWFDVLADGRVAPSDQDRELLRQLAGYYRCLLVPLVDFAAPQARLPIGREAVARVLEQIDKGLKGTEAAGLNLRLPAGKADVAAAAYFLDELKRRLHAQKRRLWITLDGAEQRSGWAVHADGVLRLVERPTPGAAVLEGTGD